MKQFLNGLLLLGTTLIFPSGNILAQNPLPSKKSQQQKSQRNLVKFQVGFARTNPVGLAQKWMETLTRAGADGVRVVLDPDLSPKMTEESHKNQTVIQVIAKVNKRNDLEVKGQTFALSAEDDLKRWIDSLKTVESIDPNKQKGAFGLTAEELVSVYERVGKPYPNSTRGRKVSEVVQTIRASLGTRIGADDQALKALAEAESATPPITVPEELKGLSCGTVMAAVIRPLGLVMVIQDRGRSFAIVDSRSAKEHWPIGWPIQKRPSQIAPVLFKQTEVEVEGFKLTEVLQAIEAKTKIPFVFDQNSMARKGIEPEKVVVNLGRQKTFYDKLIRLCLNQSKPRLRSELRADESGQPFLWISD